MTRLVFVGLRSFFRLFAGESRSYRTRDRIMALYAPIGLFVLVFCWMALVILGFTLIYYALIRDTWNIFQTEFLNLWENKGNGGWPSPRFRQKYMRQLLQDTAGFGAAEMMRRLIGLAHVHDFWTIPDDDIRTSAESLALNVAQAWLMQRHTLTSIDELVDMVAAARPSYP